MLLDLVMLACGCFLDKTKSFYDAICTLSSKHTPLDGPEAPWALVIESVMTVVAEREKPLVSNQRARWRKDLKCTLGFICQVYFLTQVAQSRKPTPLGPVGMRLSACN
jgi:hypothetical protein